MFKTILLAGAAFIVTPALAQEMPPQENPPVQEQPAPDTQTEPVEEPTPPADEATSDEATDAVPTEEATPPADEEDEVTEPQTAQQQPETQAQPADQGRQVATPAQIAQVVDEGFPTYDKDADGNLTAEEFGEWMVALRSVSEPAFTGESAADKEWIGKALAAADTDQSGNVSKDELKSFLAPQDA